MTKNLRNVSGVEGEGGGGLNRQLGSAGKWKQIKIWMDTSKSR